MRNMFDSSADNENKVSSVCVFTWYSALITLWYSRKYCAKSVKWNNFLDCAIWISHSEHDSIDVNICIVYTENVQKVEVYDVNRGYFLRHISSVLWENASEWARQVGNLKKNMYSKLGDDGTTTFQS